MLALTMVGIIFFLQNDNDNNLEMTGVFAMGTRVVSRRGRAGCRTAVKGTVRGQGTDHGADERPRLSRFRAPVRPVFCIRLYQVIIRRGDAARQR